MNVLRAGGLVLIGLALGAQAQAPDGGIRESTDPAKAAAIERRAADLKSRPVQPTAGLVRARTSSGLDFICGGIDIGERATMQREREHYSLWVATVAKPSGAYLAGVDLRIVRDGDLTPVLMRRMEGPWLFVALPEGTYDVTGTFVDDGAVWAQTLTSRVNIPPTGQRQAVLRFDSSDAVGPERQSPPQGNSFAAPDATK